MVKNNSGFKRKETFPLTTHNRRDWLTIGKFPATQPSKKINLTWQELLPSNAQLLAEVVEEITGSANPYEHQEQAIKHLLNISAKSNLIINGGTFSGKSISFIIPGIVKQLNNETDFVVIFYPSKQLLLDQFERVKEYLVKLEEKSGIRLTCKMYSGDIGKTSKSNHRIAPVHQEELDATEQNPPNILLATFDKVWFQVKKGKKNPLIDKIMAAQYIVFDEIHAFDGYAAANIKGFIAIHKKVNPRSQFVLSSATIANVEGFRDDFLPTAKIITCPPVRGEQEFLGTTIDHAVSLLAELWKELETMPGKVCLVFLDSKEDIEFLTNQLCQKLKEDDPFFDKETVEIIHADLPYYHRKRVLDEIRKEVRNKIRIVISSSVLELGVNIPNIQVVINIGIPITQKDGIVQRFARNRSVPGERRVNVFLFDLSKQRDSFYWNHRGILKEILETNACNPILYPKQNPMILAGQIILHLRYGIIDFGEIMQFFLDQGTEVYRLARLQYTKLVSLMVLKKEVDGKILFTSQGEKKLIVQAKKKNHLIPFSIRAIKNNWSIEKIRKTSSGWHGNSTTSLGKISTRGVLKKGLPGNIITRNKEQFLVTEIDQQSRIVYVKKLITKENSFYSSRFNNRLFDPQITIDVFPKKVKGTKIVDIGFGQVFIKQQPAALVNSNPDELILNSINEKTKRSFFLARIIRTTISRTSYY
ncbi:MAG: DEAD/DEAH box helicase [Candidatus Heimdallarchaeota archaeon]